MARVGDMTISSLETETDYGVLVSFLQSTLKGGYLSTVKSVRDISLLETLSSHPRTVVCRPSGSLNDQMSHLQDLTINCSVRIMCLQL